MAKENLPALPGKATVLDIIREAAKVDPFRTAELLAEQEFADAFVAVQKQLPAITKDGKISIKGGTLRFASFENVHHAVVPMLLEHGFTMTFLAEPEQGTERNFAKCILQRGLASRVSRVLILKDPASPAMNKNQGFGAGFTYACRQGMVRLLNLRSEAPEDRDTDARTEPPISPITEAVAKKFEKRIAAVRDPQELLGLIRQHYGIEEIRELPANRAHQLNQSMATYEAREKGAGDVG